jgi:sugar phosphate isomerase/epimerase
LGWSDDREPAPLWPLERLLEAASAAGFPGVGIDHYTLAAYLEAGGRPETVGDLVRARGLVCTDIAVLRLGAPDVLAGAESLGQLASATGARICIAALSTPLTNEAAVAELRDCADVLARAGVTIALEFVSYGVVRTLADGIEICAAVGWERCRLLVDTWHFFRGGEPWSLLRALDGDRIGLLHVNDGALERVGDPVHEGRSRRLPVGAGEFALPEFLEAVAATGYRGVVSTEVLSAELRERSPEESARVLMESLRETWPWAPPR